MAKKITYEEVKEYIESQGYELLSKEYVNARTKMTIQDKEGYLYSIIWADFKNNKKLYMAHPSNSYSIHNIGKYALKFGYELISTEYKNSNKYKLQFKCPKCKEIFDITWSNFQAGHRCPYCCNSPRKVKLGVNTIWDTDRWMCDLGVSEIDAKTHSKGNKDKIEVTCKDCGRKKKITPHQIYTNKTIGCICGDGVSYPEKFIISILDQLGINYIKEYSPEWIENKRYDFYIKGYSTIIECNGMQHYEQSNRGRSLQEEQKNDNYKEQLALQNNINNYIVIDCRYSELDWIKSNILNSKLSEIFDLNKVDWLKCEEFAINSNLVKSVCEYWDNKEEWETTTDLSNKFNLGKTTIRIWLKRGKILGWCNTYSPKLEQSKGAIKSGKSKSKLVEIFKDGKSLGIFPSCAELERQSEELFRVKLCYSSISAVCTGRYKQHKGFTFRYVEIF